VLRSKNGKPSQVPLSPFAVALLRGQLARREGDCPWVFPAWGKEGHAIADEPV